MLYYAIADLHGRYDLLEKALEKIAEDVLGYADEPVDHKIITLGDYIDRGPQSAEVIKLLRSRQDDRFISLKGNHEDIAVQTILKPMNEEWWYSNGGKATVDSYGKGNFLPLLDDVKWMANLPIYYKTEHHLFVHAGVPQSGMNLPPKRAHAYEQMMWMLYSKDDGRGWKDKHVVHGHHQFADGPHEWAGRTDLDTFAYKTGRLVIGVFSSGSPGKAIRYLEVLGEDYDPSRKLQ